VLWPGHNAINVYDVVIPWRREVSFEEMGIGRKYPRQDKQNNKGDMRCHPNRETKKHPLLQPARLCSKPPTEEEVSRFLTPGSAPWYFAQGLTPPSENGENGIKGSNEG
jgi:hypothetical protein